MNRPHFAELRWAGGRRTMATCKVLAALDEKALVWDNWHIMVG